MSGCSLELNARPLQCGLKMINDKCLISALSTARRFTPDHEWVSVQDGVGTVGITDYAQKALGDVVYVEFPKVGDSLSKKGVFFR